MSSYKVDIPSKFSVAARAEYFSGTIINQTITGATQASPVVITSTGHGLTDGREIIISGIGGMTELNNNKYFVKAATANTLELYLDSALTSPVDGASFTAFASNGTFKAAFTVEFIFDRGIGRSSVHRTLTAKFGDGYEQRLKDGINTKEEQFTVAFNNRTRAEINTIKDFLDATIPASFTASIDDTVKVVCEDYKISYPQPSVFSLSAELRRVYEA